MTGPRIGPHRNQGATHALARSTLLLALLAAHLGALWSLLRPTMPGAPPYRQALTLLTMQLPPLPPPVPRADKRPADATWRASAAARAPLPDSGVPASTATPAPASPTLVPAAAASAPLELGLSREAARSLIQARNPAVGDPRGNTARLSLGERLAVAMGAVDCYLDERLPDGSLRRAEGRMVSIASSTGSADPFGHSFSTGGGFGGAAVGPARVNTCVQR